MHGPCIVRRSLSSELSNRNCPDGDRPTYLRILIVFWSAFLCTVCNCQISLPLRANLFGVNSRLLLTSVCASAFPGVC